MTNIKIPVPDTNQTLVFYPCPSLYAELVISASIQLLITSIVQDDSTVSVRTPLLAVARDFVFKIMCAT